MGSGLIQISNAIDARFEEIAAVRRGDFAGAIETKFNDIDKILQGGLRPSELLIVAGRPSMGKTAWMMAAALNIARNGRSVGIFSLEMSTRGLVTRLMAMDALVASESIRTGYVTESDMFSLQESGKRLAQLPIYIDDSGGIPVGEVRNRLQVQPVDVVMIDYLQLMHIDRNISETERVTQITREIKELCKESRLPFVVACQLSRQVEQRRDKKPMLSDLRQSGQIEQDADVVLAIYRPEVYDDSIEWQGYAEGLIIKQRDGGLGTAKMSFAGKYSLFTNYTSTEPSPTSDSIASDSSWDDVGD